MSSRSSVREAAGRVVAVGYPTPRVCRVEIASDALRDCDPEGRVAQHLKLVLPGDDRTLRTFTVRTFDRSRPSVSIEIAVHDGGRASDWVAQARPGDPVGLVGPAGGHRPRGDVDRYVFLGDETAVPAIATILEALDPAQTADVVVEIEDENERRRLPFAGHTSVRWLYRRGRPHGRLLERAFHELTIEPGATFVWAAGEAAAIRCIRRHVRDELRFARADYEIGGYWVKRLSEEVGVARNRVAWRSALAAGKSEAEVEDALLY